MELTVEYIPALIVAKDKDGNYVKISKAEQNVEYYCPVCGGIVKPRAQESKKVQPHFYHITETNCDNESILHWMFKNWLFENGSKFLIEEDEYSVKDFSMEKKIETPYGDYIPDLTIDTDTEEIYFEINYSSGKDKTYADKWTYLNKKVVEVNVKELINSEIYNTIPKFSVIFEDGEYKKQYIKHERKDKYIEFKNYIMDSRKEEQVRYIAEKFDWFWKDVKNESDEDIKLCINSMDYDDSVNCCRFLKKIKCHDKYEICKQEICNKTDLEFGIKAKEFDLEVELKKISKQKYRLTFFGYVEDKKIKDDIETRTYDGMISFSDIRIPFLEKCKQLKEKITNINEIIEMMNSLKIEGYEIECIYQIDSYYKNVKVLVNAFLEDRNEWVRVFEKELYQKINIIPEINKNINNKIRNKKIENEILSKDFTECINSNFDDSFKINIYKTHAYNDYLEYEFLYEDKKIYNSYEEIDMLYKSEKMNKEYFINFGKRLSSGLIYISPFVYKINNCKNKLWQCSYSYDETKKEYTFRINNFELNEYFSPICVSDGSIKNVEDIVVKHIFKELDYIENRHEKRLLIKKEEINEG